MLRTVAGTYRQECEQLAKASDWLVGALRIG
jgi:hypothetical protein